MYEISAHAVRHEGTIEVTVSGFLPDSCHEAKISDKYPGGNIIYVRDPEHAQVFITESSKPNVPICMAVLVPWIQTVHIHDNYHKDVQVLINHKEVLKVDVVEKGAKFIVIQLTGGIVPKGSCSIIPENAHYISIYSKVFGADSYSKCFDFIKDNCKPNELQPFAKAGGGSDAPRKYL